jgi:hypothetical protein
VRSPAVLQGSARLQASRYRAARPQAKSAASSTSPREQSGDWRAGLHLLAPQQQRAVLHRHPWLIAALSHRQPLRPATLAYLEFTLGTLEPTGPAARTGLETAALIKGSWPSSCAPNSPAPGGPLVVIGLARDAHAVVVRQLAA